MKFQIVEYFIKFKSFVGLKVFRLFFVSALLGIFLFLIEASFPLVVQGFLNGINVVQKEQLRLPDWYPRSLLASMIFLLLFGTCRGVIYMLRHYISGVTAQAFISLQRHKMFKFGVINAETIPAHELNAIYTDRVIQAGSFLQQVSGLTLVLTSTGLYCILGLKLAPLQMIIGIFFLSLIYYPLKILNKTITTAGAGLITESTNAHLLLNQTMKNYFFLKIYGVLDREVNRLSKILTQIEHHYSNYYFITAIKTYVPNIVGVVLISFLTYFSIEYLQTPGIVLIAFFYIFIRFTQGISEINMSLAEMRLNKEALLDVYRWHKLLLQHSDSEKVTCGSLQVESSFFKNGLCISAHDVSFSYLNNSMVLENINFVVGKGEMLLIKGESGAGKSTLLLIALGVLSPSKGSVTINKAPINEVKDQIFNKIAYVGPESYIINGTVRENLLFGHPNPDSVDDQILLNALNIAELTSRDVTLNMFLNEHAKLSTGQKQRIAIARAIIRKPILLVLDEATANLDAVTEENVIRNLVPALKEITTIIISHKKTFDSMATSTIILNKLI